jgi:hypothetical protein
MRNWAIAAVPLAILAISPRLLAQSTSAPDATAAKQSANFDPHDLNGSWIGTNRGFFGDSNSVPEPPLTAWAREHLLTKTISHPPLDPHMLQHSAGQPTPAKTDANGVPANIPGGQYPGEKCEPIGPPAQFNYTDMYPFQFIVMNDRIYQMFENHREWRTIWLNRDHPKDFFPSYLGDSVAKWDGNTLVVDTIGFNGHEWISENVGQYMSDAFHLVERYHLTDATHLELEMTYYDPKAWGDKPWTGWKKDFKLDSRSDSLEEQMCDPAHWQEYDNVIADPSTPGK